MPDTSFYLRRQITMKTACRAIGNVIRSDAKLITGESQMIEHYIEMELKEAHAYTPNVLTKVDEEIVRTLVRQFFAESERLRKEHGS